MLSFFIVSTSWVSKDLQGGQTCFRGVATMQATSPLSRRQVLHSASLCLAASLLQTTNQPAHAYSSRSTNEDGKLSPLLYEEQTKKVVTTSTGLQYFDLNIGNGEDEAKEGDQVSIYYTSRLRGLNGIKLDSSFDHQTDGIVPVFKFTVGDKDVLAGLNETVKGMRVQGKRRAVLKPALAYQNEHMKPEPQDFFSRRRLLSVLNTNRDSTIVFDVDLLKIKR